MPTKKYVLKLSEDERKTLIELLQKGRASGWKLLRAQARQLAECRRAGTERAHASVLDRRIATRKEIGREARTWTRRRNGAQSGIDWQFTTTDARIKLKRLYPKILQ